MTRAKKQRRGVTLAEVVVASALVGLVMVGALTTLAAAARTKHVSRDLIDGRAAAAELLEEILALPYEDPDAASPDFGIEADEDTTPANRAGFDDIDDYDDWNETGLPTRDGVATTGASGWTRTVEVKKVNANNLTTPLPDNANSPLRCIAVVVTDPDGDTTTLRALRAASGGNEQPLSTDTDAVTSVSLLLTIGGETVADATNLPNSASGP